MKTLLKCTWKLVIEYGKNEFWNVGCRHLVSGNLLQIPSLSATSRDRTDGIM
jgi:hypothetical protein